MSGQSFRELHYLSKWAGQALETDSALLCYPLLSLTSPLSGRAKKTLNYAACFMLTHPDADPMDICGKNFCDSKEINFTYSKSIKMIVFKTLETVF